MHWDDLAATEFWIWDIIPKSHHFNYLQASEFLKFSRAAWLGVQFQLPSGNQTWLAGKWTIEIGDFLKNPP